MVDEAPGWVRRMWTYLMRRRRDVVLSVLAALAGSACQTVVPLIARHIVDAVIIARAAALWPWLTTLLAVAVAAFAMSYVRRYHGGRVALAVQFDLRNDIHDHLQVMDLAALNQMSTGQLVARANSDSTLVQGVLGAFPVMSGNVLLMLMSLIVMIVISPLLATISIVMMPTLFLVSYRMRWRVFPASWDAQQRAGEVAQIVDEGANGVRVVKAFGQEDRELARVVSASGDLFGARMRAVRLRARYQPLLQALPLLAQVAILMLGGWLTLRGTLSLGTFLAFSTYVAQFVTPARQLAGVIMTAQQARAGVERIFQLLDLPPAIADREDAISLPELDGDIVFDDVWFGHSPDNPVLRGLDLHIRAGERVAVVGASGAGKSTLAALVQRAHDPERGRVLVDGRDVRDVTLHSLRRQVGIAFDEPFLFSDTVHANIAYGRPSATRAEVEAAARAAQAHDFVSALPNGYETTTGERGLSLSGGQRQRIALARAILTEPRILVLDDATSAVDVRTEDAIHEALRAIMPGRTTILVAHRLSTLRLADRIVLLDDGRVADSGTHAELVERSAAYRALFAPDQQATHVGDRIEHLASAVRQGVTPAAWTPSDESNATNRFVGNGVNAAATLGKGLGGGAARGWKLNLAPTPELLARVASLPPVVDEAAVDVAREARPASDFTLPRLLAEFRRPLLLGLALVVLDSLAGIAGPALVKVGLDDGVAKGSLATLFLASGVYLAVALADLADQVAETFVTGRAAERIMLSLRVRIWAQLQRLSLDYYEREMSGRIMTRMTTDVDQFETLIENGLLSALVSLVTFFGVGGVLLVVNIELGLLTLTVVVPLAVATTLFRRRSASLYDDARERMAIVNADFQESLAGVRESQAYAHEVATSERFRRLGDDYLRPRVAAQRLVAVYFPFVQFLSAVAEAIVLGVGAGLVVQRDLTSGALVAFILYIDLFFSPIQQLSQVFDAWQQTRVSAHRIAELMALQPLTPAAENPVELAHIDGAVALEDVHFSYPAADALSPGPLGPKDSRLMSVPVVRRKPPEALVGIGLEIVPGETVALVGETGAGKSTAMKLVARFYDPDAGAVRIDGHDLRTLDLPGYRRRLGYVPQEAFLFTGTIRDNIGYGRPAATDAEIEAAARAVGAHEFIASLDGGYLHTVTERGKSLSAGQRQLIALARAELVDPAVLLLDEATANLDLATEVKVTTAMHRLTSARTTMVIAHRLQTARTADRIVVLDKGRVLEAGAHDDLLRAGGTYAAMWRSFETAARHELAVSDSLT